MCIELRIPLFLVGKPGSSKSLAKTIVDDVMKGDAAHHELFRLLKQVSIKLYDKGLSHRIYHFLSINLTCVDFSYFFVKLIFMY